MLFSVVVSFYCCCFLVVYECACLRARARVRACVRACVCVCVLSKADVEVIC